MKNAYSIQEFLEGVSDESIVEIAKFAHEDGLIALAIPYKDRLILRLKEEQFHKSANEALLHAGGSYSFPLKEGKYYVPVQIHEVVKAFNDKVILRGLVAADQEQEDQNGV